MNEFGEQQIRQNSFIIGNQLHVAQDKLSRPMHKRAASPRGVVPSALRDALRQ
ncbi:MAG TPA: hypothetical protein VMG82_07155 [Candidatus Sulfotelmatobacter sp.]|nr:hypothetical protein [Candidatus Sulfotelmatobacter sp.]